MINFAAFGNDLYTGRRSYDVIKHRRLWYGVSALLVLASIVLLLTRGLNAGIEFTGGSEFRVIGTSETSTLVGERVVADTVDDAGSPRVSLVGGDNIRVQTERLEKAPAEEVAVALAKAYGVDAAKVTTSFVGPNWGADVTRQALIGLFVFLALAGLVLAAYFRTWYMAVAALISLVHDVVITAGVYSLSGLEVTPATVIGFLTILGYSLYDTVVVFDKVRENTAHVLSGTRLTFSESINLAVNQTLVRSINTTVVALLPVAAILFIGVLLLGAGTLNDIALSLFVGMLTGAYSSIFLAPPLYDQLVSRRPEVADHTEKVRALRADPNRRSAGAAGKGNAVSGSYLGEGSASQAGKGAAVAVLDRPAPGHGEADDRAGEGGLEVRGSGSGGTGAEGTASGGGSEGGGLSAADRSRTTRGPRNQPARQPRSRRR